MSARRATFAPPEPQFAAVLAAMRGRATQYDIDAAWPVEDLTALAGTGALTWALPADCGGADVPAIELHLLYEQLAAASLATALVLSQRDAAAGFIDLSPNRALRENLLHRLAKNEAWTSVGISQLTTSRQIGPPALSATPTSGGFDVSGTIPWCTGGERADFIVVGSVVDGGGQLLFALPTATDGVTVRPPDRLTALSATRTCAIDCRKVHVPTESVIVGPTVSALAKRSRSVPIGQAFAALGLSRSALKLMAEIDSPSARQTWQTMQTRFDEIHQSVVAEYGHVDSHNLQTGPLLRSACNELAVRTTHAAVVLYKGTGLRLDHPAQRLAREALFLLVWSSPASVVDRMLESFNDHL